LPAVTKPETKRKTSSSKTKNLKEKRSDKVESKNNKGLIGASMMLSVVGMLNYMGNQEVPMCTSLDEQYSNQNPLEQHRMT